MRILVIYSLLLISQIAFGQNVFKMGEDNDTIYYDPSNPPQVFKGGVEYAESAKYITLIIGQSNTGNALTSSMPEDSSIYLSEINAYIYNRIGSTVWEEITPGINTIIDYSTTAPVINSFGPELVLGKKLGGYIFKSGRGSMSLTETEWLGGDIFDSTIIALRESFNLLRRPIVDKVIWIQGEDDTKNTDRSNSYYSHLNTFFQMLQDSINNLYNGYTYTFKKYIVGIHDSTYTGTAYAINVPTVKRAQQKYALKNNAAFIDYNAAWGAGYQNTHYTALGQLGLGWAILHSFNYIRESEVLFAQESTPASDSRKELTNRTLSDLKTNGFLDSLDLIISYASHDTGSMCLNWVDTIYKSERIKNVSIVTDRGVSGNDTAYINTHYNPSLSTKYKLNSASVSIYSRSESKNNGYDIGVYDGTNYIALNIKSDSGLISSINNSTLDTNDAILASLGLITMERENDSVRIYQNGIIKHRYYSQSAEIPDGDIYLGGIDSIENFSSDIDRQYALIAIGGRINNIPLFTSIINNYLNGIGAMVLSVNDSSDLEIEGKWMAANAINTKDESINEYNATQSNPAYLPTIQYSGTDTVSLLFDGSYDNLLIGNKSNLKYTSFSVSLWVKYTTLGTNCGTISCLNSTTGHRYGYGIVKSNNNYIVFRSGSNSADFDDVIVGLINDNNWHHVVITFDGSIKKTYFDGNLVNSIGGKSILHDSTPLYLGSYYGNSPTSICLGGELNKVRIYSRVISPTEIKYLFNNRK